MAVPVLKSSLIAGEISPSLWGHVDFAKFSIGASTMRNFLVNYHGGAYSRAGTAFVGYSKQTGRTYPPRIIPFQFSISQGLVLEFGNFYMRVIKNGAFVTENPFAITNISQSSPAVVTYVSLSTAASATANIGAISSSYQRGDTVTIAGGVFSSPAIFQILTLALGKLSLSSGGTKYAVNDTVRITGGGIASQSPVLTVTGIGGGGAITTFVISNGGTFTSAGTGSFTQLSTSGLGTGATFNLGLFGPLSLSLVDPGAYTTIPTNPANQASSTGAGLGATYNIVWATPNPLNSGDWVFINGVGGMTALNNGTYVIGSVTPTTFTISDVYGNPIDTTGLPAYTSGGSASRIYTLATPYSETDLDYLKFTQSADVMTLCCVNQMTLTEYPEQDMSRLADNNFVFSSAVAVPTVKPPATTSGSASAAGSVDYQYVITAVSPVDGSESKASPIAVINGAVNIAATAGTITITWSSVSGVNEYNVYKALPGFSVEPPPGSLFGFAGSAYGNQFIDSNIVADFSHVPPLHRDPFATGKIISAIVLTSTATVTAATFTINTTTGSGAVLQAVIVGGLLSAIIVQDQGQNYLPTDTITVTTTGGSATASITVGPQSGTFPSVVTYYQQRRVFANTLNQPDTYFMSQPGAFNNFDSRIPTIDSDAIIGTPWSVEVNGIQWLLPMPGGLIGFTGTSVWQINGAGSSSFNPTPITPSSQSAIPQSSIGASITVFPIRIESDIIYVQAKNSNYIDATYQINTNNYTVNYITLNSSHLFTGFTTVQHTWCEEPFKTLWSIRNDGVMLSLTYLKAQEIQGWARHDTNGLFVSCCSVTEPPVDALYVATQRFPPTYSNGQNSYFIERMDNRIWPDVESCWCVDSALGLSQPTPSANLTASSATGIGQITGFTNLVGGSGYSSATIASVIDDNGSGPGTGAVPTLTIVVGVITNITFPVNQGYVRPKLVISDPAGSAGGSGASAQLTLDNSATFTASAPVFSAPNVGSVIRMGGGIAKITSFIDSQHVIANISVPITQVVQNNGNAPQVALSGNWTMTSPITVVSGLRHLAGLAVTGLADGIVIPPTIVNAQGSITLPIPATSITIGLAFQAQLQTVYLDAGEPTVQGQRKKIAAVTARIEDSGSFKIGSNQPDGSIQSPAQISLPWQLTVADITAQPSKAVAPYNSSTTPLFTGDLRIPVAGGWNTHGQVAVEQDLPLPLQILAFIPEVYPGDNSSTTAPQKQAKK